MSPDAARHAVVITTITIIIIIIIITHIINHQFGIMRTVLRRRYGVTMAARHSNTPCFCDVHVIMLSTAFSGSKFNPAEFIAATRGFGAKK